MRTAALQKRSRLLTRAHLWYNLLGSRGKVRLPGRFATGVCAWIALWLCLLGGSGCLGYRLTSAQVVQLAQSALEEAPACRSVLELEIDTDLLKDKVTLQLWEQRPSRLKIEVLSAVNPQLEGLAFTTDGQQSTSFLAHANRVLIGPADRVRLPIVIETLLRSRITWLENADPESAHLIAREREGGLVVYRIQVPLSQAGYAQYTIDARQWWVRQVNYQDAYLGQGQIVVREIDCFDRLPEAEFDLHLPDGVPVEQVERAKSQPLTLKEAQMEVSFPLRTPTYLPPGTQFAVAYRLDRNVALVYTGEHSFTLVQGPGIGRVPQEGAKTIVLRGRQATLIPDPEHAGMVLTWREDELQFSISGSLEQPEIIRLAESFELAFKNADPGETVSREDAP